MIIRVNCCQCGSWDADPVVTTPDYELHVDEDFEVASCRDCGFIYTSVRPDYETLFTKFYPDDYLCYGGRSGLAGLMDRKRIAGQAAQRCKKTGKHAGGGNVKLLEAGCATGDFLKVCKERHGWDVTGVEPNERLCGALRRDGINVINSTLENADLPDDHFDVVCMFNVLEHLWDPVASLKQLNRSLRNGGIIVLEIPNFDSSARRLFGKYWFLYHLPRHLSHYTRNSLSALMERCGFEKVAVEKQFRPTVNVLSLQYVVRDKTGDAFVRGFFSAENPLMLAAGMAFEAARNAVADSNIILAVFRKVSAAPAPYESLLLERRKS